MTPQEPAEPEVEHAQDETTDTAATTPAPVVDDAGPGAAEVEATSPLLAENVESAQSEKAPEVVSEVTSEPVAEPATEVAPEPVAEPAPVTQVVREAATPPARPATSGRVHVYSTRTPQGSRTPAIAFRNSTRDATYSLRVTQPLFEQISLWERQMRKAGQRTNLSMLCEAAFQDFPTDLDGLYALAELLPAELLEQPNQTAVVRVPAALKERLQDAAFELKLTRSMRVATWHCLSAALARQLESEGIELSW